jgi:hypothetical protein
MGERPWHTDSERVADLLQARGARGECPVCGENRWESVGELANLMVSLPLSTPGGQMVQAGVQGRMYQQGISCYVLVCGNCGFVRLHSAGMIEEDEASARGGGSP